MLAITKNSLHSLSEPKYCYDNKSKTPVTYKCLLNVCSKIN